MTDAIDIDGQEFVSAKRASKETGYTRDYIGQLARGGHIAARRVGGLWYVSLASLSAYSSKAQEYKSEPPVATPSDADAAVVFDGKEYVSASRGAHLTGYHQDYVSQLARTGKVSSRQMGNRWFIDRDALLAHKKQKDALLAAVQSESVGLAGAAGPPSVDAAHASPSIHPVHHPTVLRRSSIPSEPFYTYTPEQADLMPTPSHDARPPVIHHIRTLPSHRSAPSAKVMQRSIEPARQREDARPRSRVSSPPTSLPIRRRRSVRMVHIVPVALTIVVVLTLGFTSLKDSAVYAVNQIRGGSTSMQQAAVSRPGISIAAAAEWLELLFAHNVTYQAQR